MKFYELIYPVYRRAAILMCRDCQDHLPMGAKMLDLGCGSGIVTKEFAQRFAKEYVGVDIVDNRIFPINFKLINGRDLPFGDNEFDIVLISYVLHHADDPARLLAESKRVLKPGGQIIIFEDLYEGLCAKIICQIHGKSYGVMFEHHGGKEEISFKDQGQWKTIFEALKLKVVYEKRVSRVFNPVHKHLFILQN